MTEWGPCNATCGEGAFKRRNITIQSKNGGKKCQNVTEPCTLQQCTEGRIAQGMIKKNIFYFSGLKVILHHEYIEY